MKKVKVPIYNSVIYFVTNRKECRKIGRKLKLQNQEELEDVINNSAGITASDGKEIILGVFNDKLETLVHEITHVTFHILCYHGIDISINNQETFAYLAEFIFKKVVRSNSKKES